MPLPDVALIPRRNPPGLPSSRARSASVPRVRASSSSAWSRTCCSTPPRRVDRFEPAQGPVEVDRHPSGNATGDTAPTANPVCRNHVLRPRQPYPLPVSQCADLLRIHRRSPEITTTTAVSSARSRIVFAIWPTVHAERSAASSELCVDSSKRWISFRTPAAVEERPHFPFPARHHVHTPPVVKASRYIPKRFIPSCVCLPDPTIRRKERVSAGRDGEPHRNRVGKSRTVGNNPLIMQVIIDKSEDHFT